MSEDDSPFEFGGVEREEFEEGIGRFLIEDVEDVPEFVFGDVEDIDENIEVIADKVLDMDETQLHKSIGLLIPDDEKAILRTEKFTKKLLDLTLSDGNLLFDEKLLTMKIRNLSVRRKSLIGQKRRRIRAEIYDLSFFIDAVFKGRKIKEENERSELEVKEQSNLENLKNYIKIIESMNEVLPRTKKELKLLDWFDLTFVFLEEIVIPEKEKFTANVSSISRQYDKKDPRDAFLDREGEEYVSLMIFLSPLLRNERIQEENIIALQKDKGVKQSGIFDCACGSNEFYITQKQTRGGDEGPTTIAQCTRCNFCFASGG